jgi:hypothetical protein
MSVTVAPSHKPVFGRFWLYDVITLHPIPQSDLKASQENQLTMATGYVRNLVLVP